MKRLFFAFLHSLAGIRATWRDEKAFRLEVHLSIFLIPGAFYLAPDRISLILMVGSVLLLMAVELLNTAIEAAINRHGNEWHAESKKAKDCSSAAVLFSVVIMLWVWAACLF